MNRTIMTLLVWVIAFVSSGASAAETGNDITAGRRASIDSALLKERRDYLIYLPPLYDDASYAPARYPVMYILDGEDHFRLAAGLVHFMSEANSQIPQMIVVAIVNTDRVRDLTPTASHTDLSGKENPALATAGGGDRFLRFLKDELMPRIEADYRTAPHRTFAGHSLGGLTVLHSLMTQRGLFQAYVAIDSSLWWQDQFMVARARENPVDMPARGARVFMSLADHRTIGTFDESKMIISNMRFAEILQASKLPNLSLELRHFSGEDHGSVPLPALYHGLLYAFDGYKVGDAFPLMDTTATLVAHFKDVSQRLGFEMLPPEPLVDRFGRGAYAFLQNPALAMEYAKLNVANYPSSSHARSSLASLDLAMGDVQNARAHFKDALRLNPKNEEARAGIRLLESAR